MERERDSIKQNSRRRNNRLQYARTVSHITQDEALTFWKQGCTKVRYRCSQSLKLVEV